MCYKIIDLKSYGDSDRKINQNTIILPLTSKEDK